MKLVDRKVLRVGDYEISADTYQWILTKITVVQKDGDITCERKSVIGYYGNINMLINKINDEEIQKHLDSTKDLRECVNDAMKKLLSDIKKAEA